MTTSSTAAPRRHPGRLWLALGLGLAALGLCAYVAQVASHRLATPWYLPASATLGAILVVVALWQARSVGRILGLILVVLLAGAEWTFLLGTRLPPYTGPVAVDKPFPAFKTTRADGTPFTDQDLQGEQTIVLVSFRGRW